MSRRIASKMVGMGSAVLFLGGCAVGPDYQRPAAIVPAQYKEIKGWKLGEPRDDFAKGEWWKLFGDERLDTLEAQVAISNQTLKADEANYRQAQALIAEGRAQLFPTLTFSPSVTNATASPVSFAGTSITAQPTADWTLDVWGKIRRTIEGEVAAAQVSAADLANARLSMQSSLATAYYQLLETDSLRDLLEDTIVQYKRAVYITQNQYKTGIAARSDVITAQVQLGIVEAQAIDTGVARQSFEHAIAVLMGRPPSGLAIQHGALPQKFPIIPVQMPSTLLERRPDIAAAERTMKEQNAAIGVAIAAYYPDVSLSGALGYVSVAGIPSTNPAWSYGLTVAQTLFDAGLTASKVEAARAAYEASIATYRQTVLAAFQQVEDALGAIRILTNETGVQTHTVMLAKQAVQIALTEYLTGTQTYTTVVEAQTTALSQEEAALTTREQRLLDIVNLIVALGGGWDTKKLPSE